MRIQERRAKGGSEYSTITCSEEDGKKTGEPTCFVFLGFYPGALQVTCSVRVAAVNNRALHLNENFTAAPVSMYASPAGLVSTTASGTFGGALELRSARSIATFSVTTCWGCVIELLQQFDWRRHSTWWLHKMCGVDELELRVWHGGGGPPNVVQRNATVM